MVEWPLQNCLSQASHWDALSPSWQHVGQEVHGGAAVAQTRLAGMSQQFHPCGHVSGGKYEEFTLHAGPVANAVAAIARKKAL